MTDERKAMLKRNKEHLDHILNSASLWAYENKKGFDEFLDYIGTFGITKEDLDFYHNGLE